MGELEQLANHLGDIGAVCNRRFLFLMHAHCGTCRERVLRAADALFWAPVITTYSPGGVARDLLEDRRNTSFRDCIQDIERAFPELVELYDNTASLQDRTIIAVLRIQESLQCEYGCSGTRRKNSLVENSMRVQNHYAPYGAKVYSSKYPDARLVTMLPSECLWAGIAQSLSTSEADHRQAFQHRGH